MPTTSKGAPFPTATSANDVPADIQALANWLDARPGVSPLTTAARDALTGADLWDGRVIYNLTAARLERYNATTLAWETASVSDHGLLTGLGDDDHPQYVLHTEADATLVRRAGGDTITASAATVIPLVVRGAASQSASLLEARNGAGTVIAKFNAFGSLNISDGVETIANAGGVTARIGAVANSAAGPVLIARGAASQTAPLIEVQNSAGTVIASVGAIGQVLVTDRIGTGLFRELQFGGVDSAGAGFRTVRVAN